MLCCKKKGAEVAAGVQNDVKGGCTVLKSCCSKMPGARQMGMLGLSFLATLGPKKVRPHVQNVLAVIAIATLICQIIKRGKAQEA